VFRMVLFAVVAPNLQYREDPVAEKSCVPACPEVTLHAGVCQRQRTAIYSLPVRHTC
jgi:hypothetical protein